MSRAPVTLMDGDAQHARTPDTFEMPLRAERMALRPGCFAKLVFESRPLSERIWVRVRTRLADGRYVGTLDNVPLFQKGLSVGDSVEFEARHVIDVCAR